MAWRIMRGEWVLWAFYAMFSLNIAEASVKDIVLGNTLNGLAGFMLVILMPWVRYPGSTERNWGFREENRGDVYAFTGVAWNVAYVTWNMAFVYNENPTYFASSATLLLATLGYTFLVRKPELFAMMRVFMLALHLTIRAASDIMQTTFDTHVPPVSENASLIWGIANFAFLLILLVLQVTHWTRKGRARRETPTEQVT